MTATDKPRAVAGLTCPLHKRDMRTVCHKCPWWIHVRGKDPQSEAPVDQWGCAISWLPVLAIENSQMSRQTGAAVEGARNVMMQLCESVVQLGAETVALRRQSAPRLGKHEGDR